MSAPHAPLLGEGDNEAKDELRHVLEEDVALGLLERAAQLVHVCILLADLPLERAAREQCQPQPPSQHTSKLSQNAACHGLLRGL